LQRAGLAAQPEALDDVLILLRLASLEVIEELAALVDELHETASGGVIRRVSRKVLSEACDTLREERNLNFWGTRVLGIPAELGHDSALFLCRERHSEKPF
jgi:hypothetical protein